METSAAWKRQRSLSPSVGSNEMGKRLFDIVFSLLALALLAPLFVLAAIGIRLSSPGSLYAYTHGDRYLDTDDPERAYINDLLPIKLALETVYVQRVSFLYDLRIIARTVWVITVTALGICEFADPPEMNEARGLLLAESPSS